ncbi:MAG: protein BatD [Bacteroidales bacterium]|nr:protein BatD [Bacteroidales bacterium]
MRTFFQKILFSLCVLVCLLVSTPAYAQFTCTLKAPSEVEVGEYFQLSFVLNDKPSSLPKMNIQNFTLINGPNVSSSSSISIVNGKMTSNSSYTYTYVFVANKEGTYTFPSVTFSSGKEQTQSNALTIRVVSGRSTTNNSPQNTPSVASSTQSRQQNTNSSFNKNDYFIRATADNANPYVGQQVIIRYKMYISEQAYRYQASLTSMPSASNCWTYELGDKNAEPKRYTETLNGKRYHVSDIRSIAVYPQKSGQIKISPLEADLVVQVLVQQQQQSTGDPFFDAFFGGPTTHAQNIDLKIASNAVNLNVKELPQSGKPDNFSGLVGNFSIQSALTRDKVSADDATNLKITISGNGNLQYINAPQLQFPADIDVHDPKITDNIKTSLNGVSGSRTFEYILIARTPGTYTLPAAEFVYYDKGQEKYMTLKGQEFTLNVDKSKGGGQTVYNSTSNKKDIKMLGNDIRHIKTDVSPSKQHHTFMGTGLYYLLLALPFLCLLIFYIIVRKKHKDNQNIVLVKDRKAAKTAKKRLQKAERLLKANAQQEFYEEISQVLWGYVSDKFHIPIGQLSMDTAEEKLSQHNMKPQSIEVFMTTLQMCEYVRFSPSSDMTPEKMYEQTFNFITQIERELKN